MQIRFIKGHKADQVIFCRADGSRVETLFPHKGPVPHDGVHVLVERGFGLRRGVCGLVAGGMHPEELAAMAKAGGHPSASRPGVVAPWLVELVQAERLVECIEADLWGGAAPEADWRAVAKIACEASLVPMPVLPDGGLARVRRALADFAQGWAALGVGHAMELEWPETSVDATAPAIT